MMTNLSSIQEQPAHLPHSSSTISSSYAPLNGLVPSSSRPSSSSATLLSSSSHLLSSSPSQLEGYLHKRSSFLKSWSLKYVVVSHSSLLIFPSHAAYQKALLHPPSSIKRVDLSSCTLKSLSPSSHSRPFCFNLQDNGRDHLYSAATERERSEWVDALSRAIRGEPKAGGHKTRVEDVMSGKGRGINSNALITSSSSCSSLVSLTTFTSSSASSSLSQGAGDHCHSCHQLFTAAQRPVACHRCSRSYCDSCAPHPLLIRPADPATDTDERRMCNRCHDSLTQAALTSADISERPDSRRTTKLGSDDSVDDPATEPKIFINVPSPLVSASAAPSPTHGQSQAVPALPPLPHLSTSLSAPDAGVLIAGPQVEATKELVSPAPQPGSPPPSPVVGDGPMSPMRPAPVVKLTVKIPETREKDIRVLSAEEVARLERERKKKGLPDPNARMGSTMIPAGVEIVNGEQEKLVRRPWYACGCV